jgi:hypothetical protein
VYISTVALLSENMPCYLRHFWVLSENNVLLSPCYRRTWHVISHLLSVVLIFSGYAETASGCFTVFFYKYHDNCIFSLFISKDMYDKLLLRNAEDISESDTEKKCRSFFPGMTSTITFICSSISDSLFRIYFTTSINS